MPQGESITVTGHIGRAVEEMKTKDGHAFGAKFSLAVSHKTKNKDTGEWETKHTNWWTVVAFGDAGKALLMRGLQKGDCVRVQSRECEPRPYIDKEGNARVDLQLKVWDGDVSLVFYVPKGKDAAQPDYSQPQTHVSNTPSMGSLRDEDNFQDEFPLDFSNCDPQPGADVQIPF